MTFQGDVLLKSTTDGGDLDIQDNFVVMTGGFETAAYMSLFGGNKGDDGTTATKKKSWWGNQLDKNEPDKRLISRTQNFMLSNPATPGNLNKIIENAKLDLSWFISEGISDTIEIQGRIPDADRLELSIKILKDGETLADFKFLENWGAQESNAPIVIVPDEPVISYFESFATTDGFIMNTTDGKILSSRLLTGV